MEGGGAAPRSMRGETSDAAFSFSRTCIPTGVGAEGTGTCGIASPTESAIPGSPARCRAPAGRRAPAPRGERCAHTLRPARGSAGSCRTRSRSSAGGPERGAPRRRRTHRPQTGATTIAPPAHRTAGGAILVSGRTTRDTGRTKERRTWAGPAGREAPGSRCKRDHRGQWRSASAGPRSTNAARRTRGGRSSCGQSTGLCTRGSGFDSHRPPCARRDAGSSPTPRPLTRAEGGGSSGFGGCGFKSRRASRAAHPDGSGTETFSSNWLCK